MRPLHQRVARYVGHMFASILIALVVIGMASLCAFGLFFYWLLWASVLRWAFPFLPRWVLEPSALGVSFAAAVLTCFLVGRMIRR